LNDFINRELSILEIHWQKHKERIKRAGKSYNEVNIELFDKLQNSNDDYQEIRNQIIEANLGIVLNLTRKIWHPNLNLDPLDLAQEGIFGLKRAVEKFNPLRGVKFATYATRWVLQAITRAIENTDKLVRIPNHIHEEFREINKVQKKLKQELGEDPSIEEISEETGMSPERVYYLLKIFLNPISLSIPINKEGDELIDVIEDNYNESPPELAYGLSLQEETRTILTSLEKREQYILIQYFYNQETLEEIGKEFGLTGERIRQIKEKALFKLEQNEKLRMLAEEIAV